MRPNITDAVASDGHARNSGCLRRPRGRS